MRIFSMLGSHVSKRWDFFDAVLPKITILPARMPLFESVPGGRSMYARARDNADARARFWNIFRQHECVDMRYSSLLHENAIEALISCVTVPV